jgi:hypothetical protein
MTMRFGGRGFDLCVPTLAEPFFLTFNAEVQFRIAMTPEELARPAWMRWG